MKEEFLKRLDLLAEKLGATGSHLWEILVRQQSVVGYWSLGVSLFCFLFVIPLLSKVALWGFRLAKEIREERGDSYREDKEMLPYFLGWACSIGAVIFFITGLGHLEGVLNLMNPEYYALQEVLTLFH